MDKYEIVIIIVCFTIMLIPVASAIGSLIGYFISEIGR